MDTELSATGVIFTLVRRRRLLRNTGDFFIFFFLVRQTLTVAQLERNPRHVVHPWQFRLLEAIVTHRD